MALLWIEGFEAFGVTNGNNPVGLAQKWDICDADTNFTVQAGRVGGHSIRVGTAAPVVGKFISNAATLIVGFGFYQDALVATTPVLDFYDGTSVQCRLELQTSGLWKVYRGTSTLLGTSSGSAITTGTWFYVEIKIKFNGSTGTVDVWVNGSNTLSLTAQNTSSSGATQTNRIQFMGSQNSTDHTQLDDIYIVDTTGSNNNARLGARVIKLLVPTADAGTNQFTPDSGANHFDRLTENPIDSTTYLEDSTTAHRELFSVTTLNLATVAGVQMNAVVKVTDNTVFTVKSSIHTQGGTDSDDAGITIADTAYQTLNRVVETNPETGILWRQDQINNAQFGFKVG